MSKRDKRLLQLRPKRTDRRADPRIREPERYNCPEGHAHIYILGKRYRIPVLLDSGSNIFLINEQLVEDLHIPYHSRTDAVQIQGFTGESISSGGTNFTKPLFLEIGSNKHLSLVSCEIAPAGKYGMIIPFGWWHQEHPITDIANPENWSFNDNECQSHLLPEDEGISVEWDEDVLNDPNAVVIGRIEKVDDEKVTIIDRLPERYHDYLDLFRPSTAEKLAPRRTFDHAIDLKPDTQPPWGPIYPLSQKQLEALRKYLDDMLKQGKISPSKSPAGAPILFVPKPDGRLRLVVDYRGLNKVTIHNKYPIPLMTELRDQVRDAQIFTKLDLKDGFHLIRVRKGDEWKTAFRTRYGHYQYRVMPFGLVNAPATFQTMMNEILREFLDQGVVVYIDDILIYSKTIEEHIILVRKVLQKLREYRMAISLEKSVFHVKKVDFLGYVVATDGVTMNEKKVESVKAWRAPASVKDVQIFIGFANFYRRFIKNFSAICAPITNLLKGDPKKFFWGKEQQEAFDDLKRRFISAPILCHFYPELDTVVETDASDYALGCILSQFHGKRLHPVAFHSRKLSPAERNYDIHDKELLAILVAFMEWKHYLEGTEKPITVYTDHQNLQYFLTTKAWTHRQIRWAQKLCGFNFKIIYRPGIKGGKPDALSRRPEYRPEEGATHREQQILKPQHFGKFQIAVVWGTNSEQLHQEWPQLEKEMRIRIQRLDEKARIPTKGSKLAAGHDLYSIEDILIPANSRVLVKIGLAVAVPEGTYGRIAPRSGLATKGITVDAGVIDADYRGEVKVLLVNHGKLDYEVKMGERIAQLVVERIDDQDWMEVDGLDETERAGKGFGSTGTGLELKETQPTICFLQADGNHEFYDSSDINQHPILRKGQVLLSNTIIAKANLKGFEADFLAKVREMAEEDLGWMQRKKELESLKEKGKELPKQWTISNDLLYYKDRLFIPANEDLQTLIAKGGHDSQVAGHFGQEKALEIITRDFYWKGLTD